MTMLWCGGSLAPGGDSTTAEAVTPFLVGRTTVAAVAAVAAVEVPG